MRVCSVEGCEEKHEAKGYCKKHYRRYKKYGDPLYENTKRKYSKGVKRKSSKPYDSNHKIIYGVEHKQCSICNEWKPMNSENFYANKSNKIDGFNPYCKDCTKNKNWEYQKENRYWIENYRNNKEFYNEKSKKWAIKNKERSQKTQNEWRKNNPNKLKEYGIKRRQHKTHEITTMEWEDCKKYFNHRCAYCGLAIEEHWINFRGNIQLGDFHKEHVDHNGENDLSNCVPSCRSCNSSKGIFTLDKWYSEKNERYSQERLDKINKWLLDDYKLYIKLR